MVNFHAAVVHGAKNGDDWDFSCCHLAETLQVFVSLLHIHSIFSFGCRDQLVEGRDKELVTFGNAATWNLCQMGSFSKALPVLLQLHSFLTEQLSNFNVFISLWLDCTLKHSCRQKVKPFFPPQRISPRRHRTLKPLQDTIHLLLPCCTDWREVSCLSPMDLYRWRHTLTFQSSSLGCESDSSSPLTHFFSVEEVLGTYNLPLFRVCDPCRSNARKQSFLPLLTCPAALDYSTI